MSLQTIKDILKQQKLAPSKKRGQNFLVQSQTAARIVALAGVDPQDTVVELGVGLGSLTAPLAEKAKQVIGLEIDAGIIAWQQTSGNLAANVTLLHQDLLLADFAELARRCGGRLKIMANLPYSVSNPLLFKLLDNRLDMEWAVLMLQKEVADRLRAVPGTGEYGILSVLMAGAASVTELLHVDPGQFHPRPKVDSVVVKITFYPTPRRVGELPPHDQALLRLVVKSAFQKRRKTLQNSLSTSPFIALDRDTIHRALLACGIDPATRAERLTIEQYVALTRFLAAGD
jgi:16S rRNA (adenine1518-N6/adenine1519-N6)-dimethyltransferase